MGNHLVVNTSSQHNQEALLLDHPDLIYDSNLGFTTFFRVARAKHREGSVVVKVLVLPDETKIRDLREDAITALKHHRQRIEEVLEVMKGIPHCLPFQKCILTDKAGFIIRQYVKDNLYDRISTRPFLSMMEKKWIAYQLLKCLKQCHELNICHGDMKLENIMVTSWNWVLLTDFASFKPTYLPMDNPGNFIYFFYISGRPVCYLAPERFVGGDQTDFMPKTSLADIKDKSLLPSMDIFSLGCSLSEFFPENNNIPPFDFSELLSYIQKDDFDLSRIFNGITDPDLRELAWSMISKYPSGRLTAAEYLEQQRDKAFPEYFYSFLEDYIKEFSTLPIMSPDEKAHKLKRDLSKIMEIILGYERKQSSPENSHSDGLGIIFTLMISVVRALSHCTAKLSALEVLRQLCPYLPSDVILDVMLPYLLYLVSDTDPKVRVSVIQVLTESLTHVKTLSRSNFKVFPVYIIPLLAPLPHDKSVLVRMTYAENISSLAETALRFLDMTQGILCDEECLGQKELQASQVPYDIELRNLQELIQQSVTVLLSDPDNAVRQTLLEKGMTRLCVFFGKQKGNDVLLSHMITYLNDKEDRHLRSAFFSAVVGVAAYVGWQCCPILKPLLQQGMADSEEFVIAKTLKTMLDLTELGLIRKRMLYDLIAESVPLLLHPNLWIKQAAVGFACSVARILTLADVQCRLIPLLNPFLKTNIVQVKQELVLLHAVQDPLPRCIFDYLVTLPSLRSFLDSLRARKVIRSLTRPGHIPAYRELDPPLVQVYKRLHCEGLNETVEEQIIAMGDQLSKIHAKRSNIDGQHSSPEIKGKIELSNFSVSPKVHSVLLFDVDNSYEKCLKGLQSKRMGKKKGSAFESPTVSMNDEWKHMFGSLDRKPPPSPRLQSQVSDASSSSTQKSGLTGSDLNIQTSQDLEAAASDILSFDSMLPSLFEQSVKPNLCVPCQEELVALIEKKQDEFARDEGFRCSYELGLKEDKSLAGKHQPAKVPAGLLVAHLHEHKAAINRVQHIPKTPLFATCSNDGTVKLWDCEKMEGKNIANRSKLTYSRLDGPVSCMTPCQNMQSLAAASDNGQIHVFRIANEGSKVPVSTRTLDPQEEGCAVDLSYFDTGRQSVLAYATLFGSIVGWDLRSPGTAWKLQNDSRYGLITSFCVDPTHCWLVLGTASGNIVCWDLRFQLCITTISHPAKSCIRSLLIHPNHQSAVLASVKGNNDVSMWDIETETRLLCLWASNAPPLSTSQPSDHSVYSMCWSSKEKDCSLLTAGSDMRIRYWNLNKPESSTVIAYSANDVPSPTVSYRSQVIEGTEVIQEQITRAKQPNTYDPPRRYPELPPVGHRDTISGICLVPSNQNFVVSASRDGMVKVWK